MSGKPQMNGAMSRLAAVLLAIVLSSVLFSSSMLLPPAGLICGLLAPFPVMVARLRQGRGSAVVVTLVAALLVVAGFGNQAGVLYLVQCGVMGLLLPELLLRGLGGARSIAWTTAANLVACVAALLLFLAVNGQTPQGLHEQAVTEIRGSITRAVAIYEQSGISGDDLATLKRSMAEAAELLATIYPALLTLLVVFTAGCNLALLRRYALRTGMRLKIGEFVRYRNPEPMIWALIVAGFAMLTEFPAVTIPALNLLVVLALLYFLQGMAVLLGIMSRFASSGMLRVMLYLLLVVQPYVAAAVVAIGIFDLWGDFRTPRKQENL